MWHKMTGKNRLGKVCSGLFSCVLLVSAATPRAGVKNDLRLVSAARNSDHAALQSLVKQHVDINAAEPDGATALSWASQNGDIESARILVAAGANANAKNRYGVTPLGIACSNGDAPMVELLL